MSEFNTQECKQDFIEDHTYRVYIMRHTMLGECKIEKHQNVTLDDLISNFKYYLAVANHNQHDHSLTISVTKEE